MRVLITGGSGFIGSHLCRCLLERGDTVVCVDNLQTGSEDNIAELRQNERFMMLFHDVTIPLTADKVGNVDRIFNLACPASPIHYQNNPVKTIETNVIGAINMLNLARKTDARILQASTSEIYGDPHIHPQKETYWGNVNPIGVRSCYDEGKRAAETLFFDYYRQYGVDIRVVRIFNTYGPHMRIDDGRVISNFIVQALRGENITIYGDGLQTRSFCYVDDLVDGMIRLMDTDDIRGPVNMGNPTEYSIRELSQQIIHKTGSTSRITFKELPQDDPVRRKPDISLAESLLDWHPTVSLDDGLDRTISYFTRTLNL